MIAVSGAFGAPLSFGTYAVQLHELLHAILAHTDTACQQFLPSVWPAVAASRFGVNGLDVRQQGVVAEMAILTSSTRHCTEICHTRR